MNRRGELANDSNQGVPIMQPAVRQAIAAMHERYFEPITLNDLASEVFVSPFHFSRIFSRATGVTPGRYLTAVRLFEAKRLLLTTSLTVSDIVCSVGYSSVGTFTSRFTRAVGMSPTQYRDPMVSELLVAIAPHFQRLPSLKTLRDAGQSCAVPQNDGGSVVGRLDMPPGKTTGNVLIGVFSEAIPQCGPVAFKGMADSGSTELIMNNVPPGRWHVIAVAEHNGAVGEGRSYSIATAAPIAIDGDETAAVNLRLRPVRPTDPPIAITLASRVTADVSAVALPRIQELPAVA